MFFRRTRSCRCLALAGIVSWVAVTAWGPTATAAEGEVPAAARPDVAAFLSNHCLACHGPEKKRAEVDVEPLLQDPALETQRELWEKIRHVLAVREMPPENRPQPGEELRQSLIAWLDAEFERMDAQALPRPGAVTLRRLNRNEYRNTVRDLLGIEYDTGREFPNDESGYGFDNIGDVLSLPPMLLEKYLAAAEAITERVILTEDPARQRAQRIAADRFSTTADAISTVEDGVWAFHREGEIVTDHPFPRAGAYVLRLRAYGEQAGPELPRLGVRVDGREVHVQAVRAVEGQPEAFEVPLEVEAGTHRLGVAYLNNFNADGDRNVFLVAFDVVGPMGGEAEAYPEPHRRILPQRPARGEERAYAAEVLRTFVSRAYRRPATDDEVRRLTALVGMVMDDGGTFERGIQVALQAVLVSPHFLYRWELDPPSLGPGEIRSLNDYEIASRLSYFLWSSMPDDALFAAAGRGELTRPEGVEAQVRRMLRDAKASALVENFGGQWLQIRNLDQVEPDPTLFPTWSPSLREAMRRETELFLGSLIREDRSIFDLIEADDTYLNEELARHYGIPGVEGSEFRRVALPPDSVRGGVLTMGSVLTVTSVPTRTAPVLRGKWILEQILGTPPPPPPPDVPPIEEGAGAGEAATLRQRLELHRSKPECMSCHQKMDPLGFALENFDGIGAWRTMDGPHPVDNAAELPGGRRFAGADGLKEVIRSNPAFPRALASKLLTFALGRGLEPYDRPALTRIVDNLAQRDYKFAELVLEVVRSEPFLKRQPTISRTNHARLDQ